MCHSVSWFSLFVLTCHSISWLQILVPELQKLFASKNEVNVLKLWPLFVKILGKVRTLKNKNYYIHPTLNVVPLF